MKNKSYIGIAFIVLVFGIFAVPKIINRIKSNDIIKGDRLNIEGNKIEKKSNLYTVEKAPLFKLINQHNLVISNKNFEGKVYVVEFFFATCPTICPIMNRNLKKVHDSFSANSNFGVASITINPENDTPDVLLKHSKNIGAVGENWHFLTGNRDNIYKIANEGFNLLAIQNSKIKGGFEHSGYFALIDKNGDIRCRKDQFENPIVYYDGLEEKGIKELMQDITILLKE